MILRMIEALSLPSQVTIRILFVILLLAGVSNAASSVAVPMPRIIEPQQQVTIPALQHESIYLRSGSSVTIVGNIDIASAPTIFNVSQLSFETIMPDTTFETNNPPQNLHMALVYLPPDCKRDESTTTKDGKPLCDFSSLGIGPQWSNNHNVKNQWCCSSTLKEQGYCQDLHELIIDHELFQGQEQFVTVSQEIGGSFALGDRAGIFDMDQTPGDYALILANCQEHGLDLQSIPQLSTTKHYAVKFLQTYHRFLTSHFLLAALIFAMIVATVVFWTSKHTKKLKTLDDEDRDGVACPFVPLEDDENAGFDHSNGCRINFGEIA